MNVESNDRINRWHEIKISNGQNIRAERRSCILIDDNCTLIPYAYVCLIWK